VILPDAFEHNELKKQAWPQVQDLILLLREQNENTAFAVRSSAISEDSLYSSFAGEFETILGVQGEDKLRQAIEIVRRSRESKRVQVYSDTKGNAESHEMAVII